MASERVKNVTLLTTTRASIEVMLNVHSNKSKLLNTRGALFTNQRNLPTNRVEQVNKTDTDSYSNSTPWNLIGCSRILLIGWQPIRALKDQTLHSSNYLHGMEAHYCQYLNKLT